MRLLLLLLLSAAAAAAGCADCFSVPLLAATAIDRSRVKAAVYGVARVSAGNTAQNLLMDGYLPPLAPGADANCSLRAAGADAKGAAAGERWEGERWTKGASPGLRGR